MQSSLIKDLVKSPDEGADFSETFLISLVHLYFKLHLKEAGEEEHSKSSDVGDISLFADLL